MVGGQPQIRVLRLLMGLSIPVKCVISPAWALGVEPLGDPALAVLQRGVDEDPKKLHPWSVEPCGPAPGVPPVG